MAKFARGDNAVGICARGGHKMLLRDMVSDGQYPGLMVDPAWRDIKNPQERKMTEGIALRRPAPDIDDDTAGAGASLADAMGFPAGSYFGSGT